MADTKTHETEPNLNKEYIKIDGANRSGLGRELTLFLETLTHFQFFCYSEFRFSTDPA